MRLWIAKLVTFFRMLRAIWNAEINFVAPPPPAVAAPTPEPERLLTMSAASPVLGASGRGSTTTAQKIIGAPAIQISNLDEWAANTTYANGAYVRLAGSVFMCLVGGASGATAPTLTLGDLTDNEVTWRHCLSHKRHGLILCCIDDTDPLDFDFYPGGLGPRLMPNGGTIILTGADCPQNEVWAVTGGAGAADHSYTEW